MLNTNPGKKLQLAKIVADHSRTRTHLALLMAKLAIIAANSTILPNIARGERKQPLFLLSPKPPILIVNVLQTSQGYALFATTMEIKVTAQILIIVMRFLAQSPFSPQPLFLSKTVNVMYSSTRAQRSISLTAIRFQE